MTPETEALTAKEATALTRAKNLSPQGAEVYNQAMHAFLKAIQAGKATEEGDTMTLEFIFEVNEDKLRQTIARNTRERSYDPAELGKAVREGYRAFLQKQRDEFSVVDTSGEAPPEFKRTATFTWIVTE